MREPQERNPKRHGTQSTEFQKLDKKIDRLESQFTSFWSSQHDWKALWSLIKEISSDFKGIRYPSREERNVAWTRFQSLVENIKEAQAKESEARTARSLDQSASHLSQIQSLASSANVDGSLGEVILHLATGGASLITKIAFDTLLGESDEELRQLQERSGFMKQAWSYLSEYKAEMTGRDKAAAYALLEKAKARLDRDWANWKSRRQELIAERNQQREARQREWKEKRDEWRIRQKQFIERLEGAEEKLEGALFRRQEHLAKLIDQYQSAWSDSYRDRVEGWIDEERNNIADIEAKLDDVRSKLSEARIRLDR